MWTTVPLPYLLITVKESELEKIFFLLIYKVLGLFVNALTVGEKYSLLNRDNLAKSIQMQLSQKEKKLLRIFFSDFEIYINYWTFSKKGDFHNWFISEITDSGKRS